jgi:hypothetical protein
MSEDPTKNSVSPARRALVELMQEVNFGRIELLVVRDGEPLLDASVRVVRQYVFGKVVGAHRQRDREDFVLKSQIRELFAAFDREQSLIVEELVISDGLPVRMTVRDGARA